MQNVKKFLFWLDKNILLVLTGFLLAFIPLYPKIPLWSPIEQYIVRVRLEDFFILFTVLVWGIQVIRRKVKWLSPMFFFVFAYAVVGLASTLIAIFVIKTVPEQPLHVGKTFLHFFRYLEYFSLFFVAFSAVKKKKDVAILLGILTATVVAITVYGYGQRYFYWPVFSTMNREFSKGIVLYLTPHARVQSTFGGHYDMAAFLVIGLPLLLALAYRTKNRVLNLAIHFSFWIGSWLLILSASRTPFGAYLVGVFLAIFLTGITQETWKKKFSFIFSRGIIAMFMTCILVFYFGTDMVERLGFVVKGSPTLSKYAADFDQKRKMVIPDSLLAMIPTPERVYNSLPQSAPPSNGVATDNDIDTATKTVASKSDQPPTPLKPSPSPSPTPATSGGTPKPTVLPSGVYEDIPDIVYVATKSASGEIIMEKKQRPRIYSKCALEKELSLCIRQETLWPRAMEGFLTNPLTGSGYATLTKEQVDQFTEADSTDNNFLRTLGETGGLGFLTFYGCVALVLFFAVRNFTNPDPLKKAFSIGLFCGTVGLLLNAVYIDVFAASKVAQSYWAISGIFLGYLYSTRNETEPSSEVSAAKSTASAGSFAQAMVNTEEAEVKKEQKTTFISTKKKKHSKK
jgi:hypothetical protein